MVQVFGIETDEGGRLEIYPSIGAGDSVMLRIEPPKKKIVDSIGWDKNREDELREFAYAILDALPPDRCGACGRGGR